MPELPEVETTRRGIAPHVVNKQVIAVLVREGRLRWPVPENLAELLQGAQLIAVERRAKYLLLNFTRGILLIHLGMSGNLRIVTAGQPPAKHDHIDITFSQGIILRYSDPRRFGSMLWYPAAEDAGDLRQRCLQEHPLLARLGPEPLSELFDGDYLYPLSRRKKQPVKTFLMDNKNVVGVGNIYANEALFMAGIKPTRPACQVSRKRYRLLADAVKEVLSKAIAQGGTTLRDFVGGDGKPGYFKQQLNVYGRKGLVCTVCGTVLKEVRLGQRSTVFCQGCQR